MPVCSCKKTMVLLSGQLRNARNDEGKVYACPACDVPDKPVDDKAKTIIQLSQEKS